MIKPIVPAINWNNPLTKGLVLDVPFFERGSNLVSDVASKAIPSMSGTIYWDKDIIGTVGVLNKTQYINFPDSPQLSFTAGCSVQAIVKLDNLGSNNVVISKRSSWGADTIPFELNCDAQVISWRVIGNGANQNTGNINSTGVWYNIVGTWDGITQNLYRDALFLLTQARAGSITDNATTATIGGLPGAGGEQFGGSMAAVRVWNRGLNKQEVIELYKKPWGIYRQPNFYQPVDLIAAASSTQQRLTMMGIGS